MKGSYLFAVLASLLMLLHQGDNAHAQEAAGAASPAALAVVGPEFTYQGQLKKNGSPVSATCTMTFSLWDQAGAGTPPTGGTQIGTDQTIAAAPVADGLFTVQLNGAAQFGANAFKGDKRWLQTTVQCPDDGSPVTLTRQPLTPTPYALFSAAPWVTSGTDLVYEDGNVGIGTGNPDANLDVRSGSVTIVQSTSVGSGTGGWLYGRSANGSPDTPTASLTGNELASFRGSGHDGSNFRATRAYMSFNATEDWNPSANGAEIVLATTPDGTTSPIERMRITQSGNVGIGTGAANLDANLDVRSDSVTIIQSTSIGSGTGGWLYGKSANGTPDAPTASLTGNELASFRGSGHDGSNFRATRAYMSFNATEDWNPSANGAEMVVATTQNGTTSPVERLRITDAGNVGIGTDSPDAKLDVRSGSVTIIQSTSIGSGTGGWLYGKSANGTPETPTATVAGNELASFRGSGHDGSNFRATRASMNFLASQNWSSSANGAEISFATTPNGTSSIVERMRISQGGNVGIGTTNPTRGKLEVLGGSNATLNGYGFLNSNGAGSSGSTVSRSYSIFADSFVAALEFNAFSDARVKQIQGRSDGAEDLTALSRIEITDYTLTDVVANGSTPLKKVIGQQVDSVYPQAVSRSINVVPDIYQQAAIRDGWVALATDLRPGERVRLIGVDTAGIYEVLETTADGFRTDFEEDGDAVFVYGREVEDFLSVDYDAIAMLNVSATQELYRLLQSQAEEINEVMSDNESLGVRVTALEQEMSSVSAAADADSNSPWTSWLLFGGLGILGLVVAQQRRVGVQ